jgi:hypothetical protein
MLAVGAYQYYSVCLMFDQPVKLAASSVSRVRN